MKHLLSHRSGLGSYWGEEYEKASKTRFMALSDYKPLVSPELAHEPGTGFRYSNTGFLLLGVIIEKVTGESYFDYCQKNVFEPAGMVNTGCFRLDRPVSNLATGYYLDENEEIRNNTYLHVARGGPAGGGYTTAMDMVRFARSLWNGTLVKKETFALMTSPAASDEDYGLGFGDMEGATGHTGGFPGISDIFIMTKEPGRIAVIMSNFGSIRPLMQPLVSYAAGVTAGQR